MNVDLGGVRTTLTGSAGYKQALAAWLIPRRPDRGAHPAEVAFTLKETPAPAAEGPPDVVVGSVGVWVDGSRLRAVGDGGLGGQLDLAARRGAVHAPSLGTDRYRRAVHFAFRPLWYLALGRAGRHLVHAAAVIVDGCPILVSGWSGAGKSTLAVRLALEGGVLVSDDAVFLDDTATTVYAAGERARLHPDQAARLGVVGRRSVDEKLLVDVPDRAVSLRPERLVFLDEHERDCRSLSPSDAMARVMPAMVLGVDRATDPARLGMAAALVERVPALVMPARPREPDIAALRAVLAAAADERRSA